MEQKRIRLILSVVIVIVGFLFTPSMHSYANEIDGSSGKMRLEIERIGEKEANGNVSNLETELEKRFPELFKEETKETIEAKQTEMNRSIGDLEESLFTMDLEADTSLSDIQETLFTETYIAPKTATLSEEEDNEESMSKGTLAGLIGVIGLLCAGVYTLLWRFTG